MSFVRPELAARLRLWRETLGWAALAVAGLWLVWYGYGRLEPVSIVAGFAAAATGIALLRPAINRMRLRGELGPGVVVLDEARIGYLGPHDGGFVDLPSVVRVEIVSLPDAPPESAHAWVITAEDGTRLTIPAGATGAERLFEALAPLPGIDFDAGLSAMGRPGRGRATVWRKPGEGAPLALPRVRH